MKSQKWIACVMLVLIAICTFFIVRIHPEPFDVDYWVNFLTGILTNLIVVGIALFIFDKILANGRDSQLRQINQARAEFIVFEMNRFLFKLLVGLKLIDKQEYFKGEVANSDRDVFSDVLPIFQEKVNTGALSASLKDAMEKHPKFILNFLSKLTEETFDRLIRKLEEIYPQPKPELMEMGRFMRASVGYFDSQKPFLAPTKTTFKGMSQKAQRDIRKMLTDHASAFKIISFTVVEPQLNKLLYDVLTLRSAAIENRLHLSI
ncbi:hypothetical protein IPG41_02720 [Candidatus Peregrinibacteria bacterium]|nr:MAG: hypothetical protein IPG41_02720 [Candidatus Peregrinibacteria bacterium]